MILNLGCASVLKNANKFADAATAICDGMSTYEKYDDRVDLIKQLIEKKDYAAALFEAKSLYADAQMNGDMDAVQELTSLVSVLSNIVSKLPLAVQKPPSGHKIL